MLGREAEHSVKYGDEVNINQRLPERFQALAGRVSKQKVNRYAKPK